MSIRSWENSSNRYLEDGNSYFKDNYLYLSRVSIGLWFILIFPLIIYAPILMYDEELFFDESGSFPEWERSGRDYIFQDSTWYFAYYGILNERFLEFKTPPSDVLRILLQTPSLTVNPNELTNLTDGIETFKEAVTIYGLVDWIYTTDLNSIRLYLSHCPPLNNGILKLSQEDLGNYLDLMNRIDRKSREKFYPMVNRALLEEDKRELIEFIIIRIGHIKAYKDLLIEFKLMNSHVLYGKQIGLAKLIVLKPDSILKRGSFQDTLGKGLEILSTELDE